MDANLFLPVATAVISFVFALIVFDQYIHRRRPYQLAWTLGLAFFGIGALMEYLGAARGWSSGYFRWWYLTGAYFTAAYLGMGTIYLMARRRVAHIVFAVLIIASALAAYRVFTAPVDISLLPDSAGVKVTGEAFPKSVRLVTPVFNVFGAGAMIIGALYSAWSLRRRRTMTFRVVSNILIAGGAMLSSTTGLSRVGIAGGLYLGLFLGVLLIFIGFLISIEVFEQFRVPFTNVVLRTRQQGERAR